jgi:hypothetical protein
MSLSRLINSILTMLNGKLPAYCYYADDDDFSNFFDNLMEEDYEKIYDFLLNNEEITESDGNKRDVFYDYIYECYNYP